ncbi:PepSY-associated TM helix domain-containing protein [Qipengyuania sp. MTN3-11]|uniref:PepSY-associated TM helix domain-containing protein n=1 Tax=Qipengyuania sp. MTN3-11 TaxID=3056557 RepID=UPI0036F19FB7
MADTATYRTVWRWHFYAGLFVLPFVLLLSISGAIYLFKPQIDRWEERDYRGLALEGAVSADRQLEAAKAAFPSASFHHYRLPEHSGDAAMVQMGLPDGSLVEVFVSPQAQVLGTLDPADRISNIVARFHGSLMMGDWGDRLVELAASWTIVMILTGLYLWWPRPFRAGGTLWPRFSLKGRALMKDLHRVTGFWIAGLVLLMLASGLPWAGTWGSAFAWARAELGLVEGVQEWSTGAEEAAVATPVGHDHGAEPQAMPAPGLPVRSLPLAAFVQRAEAENMAFPALVLPPHAPQRFGPPTGDVWTVKSEAQNRPLVRAVTYDPRTGAELSRSGFADKHPIDRAINIGIAWHEGALFGLANQIMGLLVALALVALSVLGVAMWLKRRPRGQSGTPSQGRGVSRKFAPIILVLALLLPLFGLSLIAIYLIDRVRTVLVR